MMRTFSAILVAALVLRVQAAPTLQKKWRCDETAMDRHIKNGHNILGYYEPCQHICDWMGWLPDDTPLVQVNIPGTHDTSTWNYTQTTQDEHIDVTGTGISPAIIYQCQDQSIFQQLNAGMRAFDLRIGFAPDNQTIIFYHGPAVLSLETTFEDVLYGFYNFLDEHPTETLVVSIKVDNTTWGTPESLQKQLYQTIFSHPATSYFNHLNGTLDTLGQSRGKINLLRRFDWSNLSNQDTKRIGIAAGPEVWLDNVANFTIEYADNNYLYIEDYYDIGGQPGVDNKDTWKYNATVAHLDFAANEHLHSPFITFSSAEKDSDDPPEYPRILALGNGTVPGVNQRLLPWLQERKGQRRGIVLMDWYAQVPGLVETVIGL